MEHVERALNAFPVRQMKERIRYCLTVAPLKYVLRTENKRLHFQQVLGHVRIKFDRPMNRLHGIHLRRAQTALAGHVG